MSCLLACSVDFEIRIMRFSPTLRHDSADCPCWSLSEGLRTVSWVLCWRASKWARSFQNDGIGRGHCGLPPRLFLDIWSCFHQHWFDWHDCKMGIWRTWILGESAKSIPVFKKLPWWESETHLSTFQTKIMMWWSLKLPRSLSTCSLKSTMKLEISTCTFSDLLRF